jgi:hypothetical protein
MDAKQDEALVDGQALRDRDAAFGVASARRSAGNASRCQRNLIAEPCEQAEPNRRHCGSEKEDHPSRPSLPNREGTCRSRPVPGYRRNRRTHVEPPRAQKGADHRCHAVALSNIVRLQQFSLILCSQARSDRPIKETCVSGLDVETPPSRGDLTGWDDGSTEMMDAPPLLQGSNCSRGARKQLCPDFRRS